MVHKSQCMRLSRAILNFNDSESSLQVKTLGSLMIESAINVSEMGSCPQLVDYCYPNTTLYLEKHIIRPRPRYV